MPRLCTFIASLGFVAALMVLPTAATAQTSGTWTNTVGGTWNDTGNWSGGVVAGGTGAAADFSTLNINTTRTVTLNAATTLGSLSFADISTTSTGSWVISNGGVAASTLTLAAGTGTTPLITVANMGSGNATIGANLVGSQGFILNSSTTANPGTLVLSGSSSVSGNIAVNSGGLFLSNTSATAYQSGTFQLANGATLRVAAATQSFARPVVLTGGTATFGTDIVGSSQNTRITFSGTISGSGGLTIDSTIGFEGAANNTYSGNTTITPTGWLLLRTLGSGSSGAPTAGPFGTGTVTLNGGGMRQYNGTSATIYNVVNVAADTSIGAGGQATDTTIFAGPMTLVGGTRTFTVVGNAMQYSGPGIGDGGIGYGLTKAGSGLLMLGGSNTFTGATTLNSGTLRIDNQNAVRNSTFTHSGTGTLVFSSTVSGNAFAFGGLAASSTAASVSLQNNAGTPAAITLTVGGNNATTAYAGSLTGAGSVVKVGTGILSLSGSNSYAGTMTVSGGVLSVSSSSALPGWGTGGRVSVGVDGALAVGNDMTLQQAIDAGYLAATSGIGFDTTADNRTVNDVIAGSRPFVKTGGNVLTLAGANTYAAPTTVAGGAVNLGVAQDGATSGPLGASGTITFSGGAVQYSAANQHDYSPRFSTAAGQAYSVDTNGQSVIWAADLGSVGGSLTKSGVGSLTLSGSNSYTGSTRLAGGVLALGSANALPSSGAVTFAGGTLQYSASNTTDIASRIASSMSGIGIDTNGQSVTWTGNLANTNTGGLVKTGAGSLALSGSNAYTGNTSVTSGTIWFATPAAWSSLSGTFSVSDATLLVSATSTFGTSWARPIVAGGTGITIGSGSGSQRVEWNSVISGTGGLTYAAGSYGLGGLNTYSGPTTIGTGVALIISATGATGTGGAPISGPFGTGTVTLAGGSLRTFSLTPSNVVINNAVDVTANTTFAASGNAATSIVLAGPMTLVGGTRTFTTDSNVIEFNGSIGDGGNGFGLVKAGTQVLVLGGSNTYSGATTLNSGTLRIANQNALQNSSLVLSSAGVVALDAAVSANAFTFGGLAATSSAATLALQNSAATAITLSVGGNNASTTYAGSLTGPGSLEKVGAGTLTLSGSNTFVGTTTVTGGTLRVGAGATTGSLAGNIVNNAAIVFDRSNTSAYAGGISGSGSLAKSGAGTLTLSGSNSYAGPTTLAGGALAFATADALPATGDVTFTGGSLQYSGSFTADLSTRIIGSSGAVAINTNGQNITFASGLAASNVGGLTKSGVGTLTLSASNAHSGETTVTGGSLLVTNAAALGSGTTISVSSPASLSLGSGITTGDGKTVTVNSFAGAGGLQGVSGAATWVGNVVMGSSGRLGYDQSGSLVVSGSVGGTGLIIAGYGGDTNTNVAGYAVTLAGPTGYTGATSILRGWLKIGADDTLPAGTTLDVFTTANNFAAGQAATFDLNGFNQTVAGLTSSGNNGKTGYANGYVTNTGPTVKMLTVDQATTGTYGGLITGNLAFTKAGAGNLTLMPIFVTTPGSNAFTSGTNTFTGDTLVSGGTLTLSTATGSTSLALAGSTFDASGGGTLSFGSMTAATFGGLKGTGNLALGNDSTQAVALTVGANDGSTSYAGSMSGAGSLVKTGTGKLTLSGNNSYAGTTMVSGGILAVNGDQSSATGAISIAGGATLMGSGVIGGDTTIAGLHSPGNSPGIQTFAGNLTYSGGTSTVLWELGANTVLNSPLAYDQIVVGGDLTFAGATVLSLLFNNTGSTVNWADTFWDADQTWTLYSVTGTTASFGNLALAGSPASWFDTQSTPQSLASTRPQASFSIVQNGSNVNVVYAVVPEPGALALAGIGIAAAAWAIRRHRK